MRLGVVADIHGNVLAVEAVLAHARRQGVERLIDLGDVLYGPLWPRETFELIRSAGVETIVSGNQDRVLHSSTEAVLAANATLRWVIAELGPAAISAARGWPFQHEEEGLLAFHGTPSSDLEYLLEDVSTGVALVRSESEIVSRLGGSEASLVLCGHSHVPRCVRLSTGQLVVNPGSVGLPAYDDAAPVAHVMETYAPHASYAVVERSGRGWDVSHHRVAYDWTAAAARARELGREDWARGIESGRMG